MNKKIDNKYWYKLLGVDEFEKKESITIQGEKYILKNGMLRQAKVYSEAQDQTKNAFSFKWQKRETYESAAVQDKAREWLMERYTEKNPQKLKEWMRSGSKVLDAGCGSGHAAILFFGKYLNQIQYLGIDISSAIDVAAKRFKENNYQAEFIQADIMDLPFDGPVFDLIFSEGVLHHTDSTEKTLKYLSTLLIPGGRLLFYVYRKKGPVREFTDDHIRDILRDFDDEKAWEELIPLTKLGMALGELGVKVNVPEAIPYLDIPAGKIDIQRLFYWYLCKAYYRPDWNIDETNHVNYDWYRPSNCHRHTPEEIEKWTTEAGLDIEHLDLQESGITVVALKK